MKKVLFTATVDSHILQFHLPFLKMFKEKGYEVHVATNGNEEIPYCDVKHVVSFERSPFKFNNIKAIKQVKKICMEEKFDIIHTHTPMGSVVTRLAAKKSRKKYHTRVIYTAHGLHFFKGAPLKNWLMFYPVEKYLSKYTDTLILINQEDYDLCKKKFKKCKDIQYVPGVGIDEEKFNFELSKKEKKELRESLGIKENDFVMIYPAELNKNKNQEMIINAIENLSKKYKNIKVLLPGIDSYNGYYHNLVKEKKLEKYILFLGYRKDIPKLLKISDIALATSYREGLPLNVMEAMYVGLPIVATNCRGQRELVKNQINGYLVAIDDQIKFNDCIEKLYLSKNNKFGEQSKYVIKEYLLDKILNRFEKIYFKKKKIIHFLSSNKFSGAENVACTIITNLQNNYELYYCCPDGPIKDALLEKNINYLPLNKLNYFELRKIMNQINPDIIHAHDFKASCIAAFFWKKSRVISHIHINNNKMRKINTYSIIYNFLSRYYFHIFWVSQSAYNNYIFKNNVINKSSVLYNVIDKNKIMVKLKEYELNEKYDLIFLGRLTEQKNPERLIKIIKKISMVNSKIKVAIVGDGEKKKIIQNLINNYKINKNVKMFGFQKNPYPILFNSKILIMTSYREGTPMVVLEAQFLGKPVISTPVDGLKDIITDEYNGYLLSDDELFVEKIDMLLRDNSKLSILSKNSKIFFDKYNNIEDYLNKIIERYN